MVWQAISEILLKANKVIINVKIWNPALNSYFFESKGPNECFPLVKYLSFNNISLKKKVVYILDVVKKFKV